ncbi:uroporphyrinogen-III C-methyltransferase [Maritimibacter dapengensis]|uniref:uroporphyrinogen-III C-methyltransferase n=1 Tax=Maritimibacter dapengensis TaxID=2836868 RepID=A0ABS6T0Y8_9RHOB|nr:uroporphyrinogen-III C-methyltransferase [Maritimibacter dapengensis]MBV7378895.1 uroporphyrinogen-III C-methyltransferase [Maritimibacter dapengensis]
MKDLTIGTVFLIGAGPGDPDLLTVKAVRALDRADVVVYDRLVSPEILALAPLGAKRIDVGKMPKCHKVPQDQINETLVRLARQGRTVVRLKGGDPLIFGRGSEEAAELRAAGIPCCYIPGITAAQGAASTTGVPLTHRGLATGVRYVTGHRAADATLDLDWFSLASGDTTLVIYMGAANIGEIAGNLMAHGLPADTPAMAVSQATTPRQQTVFSRLDRLNGDAAIADLPAPVLFFVGQTVSLGEEAETLAEFPDNALAHV